MRKGAGMRGQSKKRFWRKNGGFTLSEAAIVLCIVAVLFGAIWSVAGSADNNAKHERFTLLVRAVVENIRSHYAARSGVDYVSAPATMGQLTDNNVFPNDLLVKKTAWLSILVSPFGEFTNPRLALSDHKSMYVCGWPASGSTGCDLNPASPAKQNLPLFAVEALLNRGDCVKALMRNSHSSVLPGIVAVYANGTQLSLPLTLAAAQSRCSNAVNYINFVLRLRP